MSVEDRYKPFTLKRKTAGAREVDEPTTTVVGYFRGFVQPISAGESQFLGPKAGELRSHRLYCPLNVPALDGDIVEQDSVEWTVTNPTQGSGISGVGRHKELLLQQS